MSRTITSTTRTHRVHTDAVPIVLTPIPALGRVADLRSHTACGQWVDGVAGTDETVTCGNCLRIV